MYRVDESDVVSVPVSAKELGTDEDRKTKWAEVQMVEDCLSELLGVEEIGCTCEKCGDQVVALKYVDFFSSVVLDGVLIVMAPIGKGSS